MRSPWVSRLAYDGLRGQNQALEAQLVAWEAKYDTLLEKYHALRLQFGANPEQARQAEVRPMDVVTEAIMAKAGTDTLRRRHYAEFVNEQRALQVSDEEIARQIVTGVDATDWGVPS